MEPIAQPAGPVVSVIIPVYNLGHYLDACLQSVETQTFRDFEAIVVDDGSTDGTGEVLRRHAARDPRIVGVHTANQGVARARETGLQRARGRYVAFLDGDDRFEPEMLERLTAAIRERGGYDIVCCNYKRVCPTYEAPVRERRTKDMEGLEFLEASLKHAIFVTVWGRLYRRSLFDDGIRHYPLRLGQDALVNFQIGCKRPRVRFIDYVGYGYVMRSGSSNHRHFNIDYCRRFSEAVGEILSRNGNVPEERREFYHLLNTLRWYLVYIGKSSTPWVGNCAFVRSLRATAERHRAELRNHFPAGRLLLFRLDGRRALRPAVVALSTLLRWQTSLQRRLAR